MAIFGFGLIVAGWIWGLIFPINKAIWTSSYVLFTGGIAALVLAGLTWLIDIKFWKRPFWVFEVLALRLTLSELFAGLFCGLIFVLEISLFCK